jgi:hypothetical protein
VAVQIPGYVIQVLAIEGRTLSKVKIIPVENPEPEPAD